MEDDFAILTSQPMFYQVIDLVIRTPSLMLLQAEDGAQLHRCFQFWFMKEDEDAIKSLSLEIRDAQGWTRQEWIISESRVQEWRSGQVSIVADFNFTVISFFSSEHF